MTSTTNAPALVSKLARKVAGATSLSFAGVLSAALGAAGLAVAGLAVAGLGGGRLRFLRRRGFGGRRLGLVGVAVAGLAVRLRKPEAVDSASAAPNMTADIAFDRTFIALPLQLKTILRVSTELLNQEISKSLIS